MTHFRNATRDINDPNCGLPIDAVAENVFVNCFEFRIGDAQKTNILLGESKYMYAIADPNDETKLLIKEFESERAIPSSLPDGGVLDAFSSDDFIEVVSGDKSGIYWERKGVIISDDGEISTANLPDGMIRIIGRFWDQQTTYKVKVNATSSSRTGGLEIAVNAPERLGTKFSKARDVFDNVVNVDSLIIANAGKYGIPPQLIKAHISKEAAIESFGDFAGFAPSYVYEPFRTEFDLRDDEFELNKEWDESDFKVTENSMGNGANVPDHLYVENFNYPYTPQTIWDMVSSYSKIEFETPPDGAFPQYGNRDPITQKITFYGLYKEPKVVYDSIIVKFRNAGIIEDSLYIVSNDSLVTFMKTKWKGGLDNVYAQTRIASSYGYLQLLYTTAVLNGEQDGAGYSRKELPEKMNEVEQSIELAMILYGKYLRIEDLNMWDRSYEVVWVENVIRRWNRSPSYRKLVTKVIQNFKPE